MSFTECFYGKYNLKLFISSVTWTTGISFYFLSVK
jgi:hypothetical protein